MKVRCGGCGRKFNGEIKTEIHNEIHGRYLKCPRCQDKYLIDFYCPYLQSLITQINLRAKFLLLTEQNVKEDIEIINLSKRIDNLSKFLLSEAKKRSNGKPCYVEAVIINERVEYTNGKDV